MDGRGVHASSANSRGRGICSSRLPVVPPHVRLRMAESFRGYTNPILVLPGLLARLWDFDKIVDGSERDVLKMAGQVGLAFRSMRFRASPAGRPQRPPASGLPGASGFLVLPGRYKTVRWTVFIFILFAIKTKKPAFAGSFA